ncbi:DUF7507 domain-containing protein [Pseudogemmobacter faecipullorum]|uniref:DUF11 domain-containing protein n=1 Tax=Pseudogemmobacter faecipullorum TaxID=2755041 RepID=A0ABS8CR11_9RHOB|nr:DUF11 domain-containing protein [Pseudogemmobacter faecipullorum]MCB5411829.1 DUF11 domain-containing protein [Pseudogemmobacter faecipullorum]
MADNDERLTGSADPIGPLGDLDPGESLIWTSDANTLGLPMAVTPDQAELDAGVLPNAARTTGDFGGEEVEAEDEVTVGLVPQAVLRLEKSGTLDAGGDEISYSFAVYNDGQVTLKDVVIRDPLLGTSWSHSFGADVTLAPGADPLIYTLTPAEAYVLLAADRERGWVYNKANANAVPDTDNPLIEPPLPAEAEAITAVPGTPLLQLTKVADDRDLTTPPEIGQRIYYTLTVENIGLVTVQEIDVTDALPGFSFDGSGTLDSLAPGASHDFTGSYPLRQEDLDAGKVINTARVEGAWVPEDLPKDPPPFDTDPPGRTPVEEGSRDPVSGDSETKVDLVMVGEFTATKTADLERVSLGDTVSYTLSFTSQSTGLVRALDIIDMLPKGLIYTPDSAVVTIAGGTPLAMEPVVSGRRLTWSIADIPRLAVVKVSFKVRVSALAPYGKLTNQTWSETPEGERNSNTATATVLREPDHVFECSDVTGKVFDDRNHNGRQDPLDRSALTNDDVYTGKFGKYEDMPKEPQGERGLPGVRLVTPTGTVITTDQHGRYSVPCAELPKDLGTNFTLKLDTRSLPSGYRVTTENPRTLRLTAGKAAEMNFGATLSKLVRLDLSSVAFQGAGAEPSAALDRALRDFAAAPGEGPLVLHLGYHLREGESRDLARKRLDNVEKILVKSWSGRRANLLIERSYTLTGK